MGGARRSSKASQSQSVADNPCLRCKNDVVEDDHGVQCEYCENWTHAKCADISESQYKAVMAVAGFKYFCNHCTPGVDRLLKLERRMDDMEAKYSDLASKISNFSSMSTKLSSLANGTILSNQTAPKPFAEAVEEAVELKLKSRNAVLFGVPESDKDDDLDVVRSFLSMPAGDDIERVKPSDVLYVFRDGPQRTGQSRFLKVVCTTSQVRQNFIQFINKVAKPASSIPLRSRPDLTYQQRVNGRKLRDKLQELGPHTHFINYQKCQIFSKLTKNIAFSLNVV